jgi:hypothetical protein
LEGLKSSMAVTESQLQRQKAEKKQLKTYAIQLKEKSEALEATAALWEKNKATLTNLVMEIRPLHLELSEQIEIISSLKFRYVQLLSSLGQPSVSQSMVESTDALLFTANNSTQTAAMLCECAEMKGYLPPSASTPYPTPASRSSGEGSIPPSSPLQIQIKSEELNEISASQMPPRRPAAAVEGSGGADDQRESEESDDSPILKSVKSSLWEFGATMLEVEESIDKLLR